MFMFDYRLCSKYFNEPDIKVIQRKLPFLTCNGFPSSDVDVDLLNDSKVT